MPSTPAGELASFPLQTIVISSTLLNARKLMMAQGVRHAGVLNEHGNLLAIISMRDILDTIEHEMLLELRSALKERDQAFDAGFVALARSVYQNNDERARIKKAINLALGSGYVEEKSYRAL